MSAIAVSGKHPAATPTEPNAPARSLAVVSLNTARELQVGKIAADLSRAPRLRSADVLMLQEVADEDHKPSVAEQLGKHLGYYSTFSPAGPGIHDQGLGIVSRYPLSNIEIRRLKDCDLLFRCRTRFALSADVETPWGPVRMWNVHLDTRINADERLEQLQPVIDAAARRAHPSVIAGDLNTNEFRWIRNVVPVPGGPSHAKTIRRAMEAQGFRSAIPDECVTFSTMKRHLDWVFTNKLQPLRWSVEPAPFSDHHAVWARLVLPE
jgi:endonuclease/exonuclease/phosphatase family metal-dependent hydrolase